MNTQELAEFNAEIFGLMAEKQLSVAEVIKVCAVCIAAAFGRVNTPIKMKMAIVNETVRSLAPILDIVLTDKKNIRGTNP